jgi:hypothetical protein
MSDTPRTDGMQAQFSLEDPQAYDAWEFARTLERELNAVKAGFEASVAQGFLKKMERERQNLD